MRFVVDYEDGEEDPDTQGLQDEHDDPKGAHVHTTVGLDVVNVQGNHQNRNIAQSEAEDLQKLIAEGVTAKALMRMLWPSLESLG